MRSVRAIHISYIKKHSWFVQDRYNKSCTTKKRNTVESLEIHVVTNNELQCFECIIYIKIQSVINDFPLPVCGVCVCVCMCVYVCQ